MKLFPAIMMLGGCSWATHYVWTTARSHVDEIESAAFLGVLLMVLFAATGAGIYGVLRTPTIICVNAEDKPLDDALKLCKRRVILAFSLPIYFIAILYGGFLAPSVIYAVVMCAVLGVTRLRPLTLIAGGAASVVILFSTLLAVPLPLWPPH